MNFYRITAMFGPTWVEYLSAASSCLSREEWDSRKHDWT